MKNRNLFLIFRAILLWCTCSKVSRLCYSHPHHEWRLYRLDLRGPRELVVQLWLTVDQVRGASFSRAISFRRAPCYCSAKKPPKERKKERKKDSGFSNWIKILENKTSKARCVDVKEISFWEMWKNPQNKNLELIHLVSEDDLTPFSNTTTAQEKNNSEMKSWKLCYKKVKTKCSVIVQKFVPVFFRLNHLPSSTQICKSPPKKSQKPPNQTSQTKTKILHFWHI